MIADNIDNLENTDTGFGSTHRVNSILVTRDFPKEQSDPILSPPIKRKCRRSLPDDKYQEKYLSIFMEVEQDLES